MKKLVLVLGITAMSLLTAQASGFRMANAVCVFNGNERVRISPDKLPNAVKTSIEKNFKGWNIEEAYMETETDEYELRLSQNDQTKTVMFDKTGNIIS